MQITSAQQMLQHIDKGGYLGLDGNRNLVKQNPFRHAMQKIADAFRSLTASGREHIKNRSYALQEAMIRLTARQDIQNPATAALQPAADIPQKQHVRMASLLAAAKAVHKAGIAPEAVPLVRRYVATVLEAMVEKNAVSAAKVPEQARVLCEKLKTDKVIMQALSAPFSCSAEKAEERKATIIQGMQEDFARPTIQKDMLPSGVYRVYGFDANRSNIRSLNGGSPLPVVPENMPDKSRAYSDHLAEVMKNCTPQMRGMVSLLACQGGLEGAIFMEENEGKFFPLPDIPTLNRHGLTLHPSGYTYDLDITDDTAIIRLHMETELRLLGAGDFDVAPRAANAPVLAGTRFDMEARVDLKQDMSGRQSPDFTIPRFDIAALDIPY